MGAEPGVGDVEQEGRQFLSYALPVQPNMGEPVFRRLRGLGWVGVIASGCNVVATIVWVILQVELLSGRAAQQAGTGSLWQVMAVELCATGFFLVLADVGMFAAALAMAGQPTHLVLNDLVMIARAKLVLQGVMFVSATACVGVLLSMGGMNIAGWQVAAGFYCVAASVYPIWVNQMSRSPEVKAWVVWEQETSGTDGRVDG